MQSIHRHKEAPFDDPLLQSIAFGQGDEANWKRAWKATYFVDRLLFGPPAAGLCARWGARTA